MTKPEKFFNLNMLFLKRSGIWLPKPNEKSYKFKYFIYFYNTICVSFSIVFFTISQIITLYNKDNDRETFIKNLNLVSSFAVSNCKVFSWFYWRKTTVKMMEDLEEGFGIFNEYEEFKPEVLITKRMKIKNTILRIYFYLSLAISAMCLVVEINQIVFHSENYEIFSNETGYRYELDLPFQSWLPFDPHSSKTAHFGAVVIQVSGVIVGGSITVSVDTLFVALTLGTTAHFELLQGAFRTVRQSCVEKLGIYGEFIRDPSHLIEETEKEMRKLIIHLQNILKICDSLETIYSYLILSQLLVSMVALCTCLFLVSEIPFNSGQLAPQLFYLMCVENQLRMYCYAANELSLSAADIPQSLYESDWLSTSNTFKHYLRFTMLRMSKPVHLTIGKFMPLRLSTFVTIGRASYSLLAILKR